jgi:hypothetical protein
VTGVFRESGKLSPHSGGWALAQVASLLENALSLPGWFDAVVITLLLLGFPPPKRR